MSLVTLVRNTLKEFSEDECMTRAQALAYQAFFSLFPLLLGAVAIAGVFIKTPEAQTRILNTALSYVPGAGDLVQKTIQGVIEQRGTVGIISALLLLFSGRAIFAQIVYSIGITFEVQNRRGFIGQLLLAVGLIFGVGTLLIVSIAVTAAMQVVGSLDVAGLPSLSKTFVWPIIQTAVTLLVSIAMFLVMYKLAPNMDLSWREVIPGAVLAGVLFEIAKWLFVLYFKNFASENVYGALGTVVAMLTWCYFASLILLIGAEVNSEYIKLRRQEQRKNVVPRPGPPILTDDVPATRRAAALAGTVAASALALATVLTTRRRAIR